MTFNTIPSNSNDSIKKKKKETTTLCCCTAGALYVEEVF